MALEWEFGSADGDKLALEQRFGQPVDAKLALDQRFGRPAKPIVVSFKKHRTVQVIFGAKSRFKTQIESFTPSTRIVEIK